MEVKKITVDELYKKDMKIMENIYLIDDFKMSYCLINPKDIIFACVENKKIVGIAAIHKVNPNEYESLFVEVLPEYRGKRISPLLLEERYKFLKEKNASLKIPNYTSDGLRAIKKYDDIFSKKYDVSVEIKANKKVKP